MNFDETNYGYGSDQDPAMMARLDGQVGSASGRRRRIQFSLRALFLLTFLGVFPLAWVTHCRRHADLTRQTLNELLDRGGFVHYWGIHGFEFLHELLGREPRIAFVSFREPCDFSDADLGILKRLPAVHGLSLRNTAVTRNGLAQLKNIHGLKLLDLRTTPLDDKAAKWLRDIKTLEALDVRETSITDVGMNEVARISTLRSLHVAGQGVSDDGILALIGHQRLELLNLSDSRVTDKGIVVALQLPELRTLFFARTAVSNEGLKAIQAAPLLQLIAMNGSRVGGNWLQLMRKGMSWRPYGTNESEPYSEVRLE